MIDTGSGATYLSKKKAENLNLYIKPKRGTVTLADPLYKANIVGKVVVYIAINGHTRGSVVVEVLQKSFIDLIVGRDILSKHNKVVLEFGGSKEDLVLGPSKERHFLGATDDIDTFEPMNVTPPTLFTNLSSKAHRYEIASVY